MCQSIRVRTDGRGRPLGFTLHGVWHEVESIVEEWTEAGRWWEGETPRRFYRVAADGLFDLSRGGSAEWRVELAWD